VENFVKPDELKQMMIQAGFKNVQAIPLTMGTVHLYFGVK
jgi:ubiquinone/menaquinone biosynthesis C-methylase UbiE